MDKNYEIVRRIWHLMNNIDGVYYYLSKHVGINENALTLLYALDDGMPHSQKEISDEWLIPRTTINSIVKTMIYDGYIEFCEEQHKKEKQLILTQKGRDYAEHLLGNIYAIEERAIRKTLTTYSTEFVAALEDFSNNLYEEFEIMKQEEKL